MKICPACGFQGEDDSVFCEQCGAKMVEKQVEPQAAPEPEPADAPQIESIREEDAQPAAGVMFCPECGASIADSSSIFCENCGASLKETVKPQNIGDTEADLYEGKKGPKKLLLIIAAAVIVMLIAGALLIFGRKGGTGIKAALYLKGGELYFNSLNKKSESLEVTDDLSCDKYSVPYYSVYLTSDGKKLFYPDDYDEDDGTFTLYYRNPGKPDSEPEKIDRGVMRYYMGSEENCLIYVVGSYSDSDKDIYYYDLKEKTKLGSYSDCLKTSEDGRAVLFIDEDMTLYYRKAGREKEKIDSDVITVEYSDDDLSTIYYMKDDDDVLYRYVRGGDGRERLIKDVDDVVSVTKDGCVYYYGHPELNYKDFVSDKNKASDAAMKKPEEPEYPSWLADDYSKRLEQYEKDYDAYQDAMEKYHEKESRDAVREQMEGMSDESTFISDLRSLYCFDGKESTMLAEAAVVNAFNHYGENGAIFYTAYDLPETVVDISEMGYGFDADAVIGKLYEKNTNFFTSGKNCIELDAEYIISYTILDDKAYYIEGTDEEYESGDLFCIKSGDGKPEKPECLDDDVYVDLICSDDSIFYFKDVKADRSWTYEGELYKDGEPVDSDVSVSPVCCDMYNDRMIYFTDYNSEKCRGEIHIWKDGKTETVAEDAADFGIIRHHSGLLYIGDYSTKRLRGTLYYYDNGKSREIDDGVTDIITPQTKTREK